MTIFWNKTRRFCAAALLALNFTALTLHAQDQMADFRDAEDFRLRAPEYFGVPADSRLYKPLQRLIADSLKASQEMERTKIKPEKGPAWVLSQQDTPRDLPLRRHYRGKYGIDLPTADKFVSPWKMNEEAMLNKLREDAAGVAPEIQEQVRQRMVFKQLPVCQKSHTEKTRTKKRKLSSEEKKQVMLDVLELRPGTRPADTEKAFGRTALVYEYGDNPDRRDDWWAERTGAKCIPFRVRMTRAHKFLHHGDDALRNYDNNPEGDGIAAKQDTSDGIAESFKLADEGPAKDGE